MASQHDSFPNTSDDNKNKSTDATAVDVSRQDKKLGEKVMLNKSNIDWQLGKSLGESLLYLYENKLWTDVSFRCKDHDVDDKDDRIRAHRIILAARSPVFHKMMFVYDNVSGDKDEQHLPTIEAAIFHIIVKYMYSDFTDLTEDTVARVMEIAHMYQIKGLVEYCATYLKSILRVDNACGILELALFYETEDLRDAACDFVDEYVEPVIQTENFKDISESCLTYLLKGDTFYAPETDIVEAADSWAKHKLLAMSSDSFKHDRRKLLGEGFYYLRVPSMTLEEFFKSTHNKNYYVTDEMYEIIKLIQDKGKDVQAVSCHSVVKRIPKYQTLNVGFIETPSTTATCTMIECIILLKVSKDCEIKCVTLQNKYKYCYRYYQQYEIKATACFVFKGKLTVDDNFAMNFNWIPSQNDEISPTCPIKLSERATPYTMRLTLELEQSKDIEVCVYRNQNLKEGCQANNHTEECSEESTRDHVIGLNYCQNSKHINVIKSIDIHNMSYR